MWGSNIGDEGGRDCCLLVRSEPRGLGLGLLDGSTRRTPGGGTLNFNGDVSVSEPSDSSGTIETLERAPGRTDIRTVFDRLWPFFRECEVFGLLRLASCGDHWKGLC